MLLVGDYSGIGKVYSTHQSADHLSFEGLKAKHIRPAVDFQSVMAAWLAGDTSADIAVFSADLAKATSREMIESLERRGISCVRYNKDLPLGGFALDAFPSSLGVASSAHVGADDVFVFHHCFFGKFAIASVPPCAMTEEAIENAAFADVDTTAQIVAFCRHTEKKEWIWGPSHVFPDGFHMQPALTAAEQYAQSCFEGMVATVNKDGEIILFRPDQNAERFARSCAALAIPPLSTDQFLDSVKMAVLANRRYLPRAGSSTKFYIRPYAKGLDGGYGVGPADSYLFAVEVFPYAGYFSGTLDIVGIPGVRRSHEGGFGAVKAAGNYGQTILNRVKAKAGLLGKDGKIYHDTFYFGEQKRTVTFDGTTHVVVQDIIDEDSAGNLLFLKSANGKTTLYTAPLKRQAVLPGVTRHSLLTLAKYAGLDVVEQELTWDDIRGMDIGFVSGTAAGMGRVGSMTYGDKKIEFLAATPEKANEPSAQAFARLYDLLFAARRGDLRHVEQDGIKDWAVVVG